MWGSWNKFHAKKTEVDGITFDSKREADFYCQLKILQRAGEVKSFSMQVPFVLIPTFKHLGKTIRGVKYIADFVVKYADGHEEVVDVKGMKTKDYIIKQKMLLSKYPDMIFKEV